MKKVVAALSILCAIIITVYVVAVFAEGKEANIVDNIAYVILIDAGHGGIDGGVLGKSGVKESDLNLAVSLELEAIFKSNGFNVIMTRRDKNGLYGLARSGRKRRDMQKRREIIKGANADLVISIHMNSSSAAYRKGAQLFFQKGDAEGGEMAKLMQELLNDRELGYGAPQSGDFYVLQSSSSPGVIVECGFLTNAEDEARLKNKDYQRRMAEGIFTGAVTYLFR